MKTELSNAEKEHVERMSEPLSEPSMQDKFASYAERVISHGKQEQKEKEKNSGPRDINLKGRPEEEREFIEKVGEKPPDESKDSAKERTEQRSDAKESEKPAASEPMSGDRHWQAVEGKVVLSDKEMNDHWKNVDARMGVALQFMNQHPQKAQMEQGFRDIFTGKPSAWQNAVLRDLTTALAEVPNPGEVLRHITLQSQDREVIRSAKNSKELRAAIQTVSKHYPAASQASPKPRAPKPPSEVGGRGAAGDDGTRGADGFNDFSRRQSQRYAHGR